MALLKIDLAHDYAHTDDLSSRGDGRHAIGTDGGFNFYAHVSNGEVVEYSADRNGEAVPVEPLTVRVRLGSPTDVDAETRCYVCACVNSSCQCTEVPCGSIRVL
jgi:hypothetical protein